MSVEVRIEHPEEYPGVAIVRLVADERKNALTGESAKQIRAALHEVETNDEVGVVVITGGPSFCAGAHRGVLDAAGREEAQALADLQDVYGIFSDMRKMTVPIIAAVRGAAVGAGLNIALAADVRIVAEDAYLRSMFIANEIHPGGGHLQMLRELAGPEVANYLAVLDNPVSGAEFASLGLAVSAVADDEVEAVALQAARRAAPHPQLARNIKSSISVTSFLPTELAATYEGERQFVTLQNKQRKNN